MDKYAAHVVGKRNMVNSLKEKQDGTLFSEISANDVAWALVMIKNSMDMWRYEYETKNKTKDMDNIDEINVAEGGGDANIKKRTRWTSMIKGKKQSLFKDGWSVEGKKVFCMAVKAQKQLRKNELEMMRMMQAHDRLMSSSDFYGKKIKMPAQALFLNEVIVPSIPILSVNNDDDGYDSDVALKMMMK